MLLADNHRVERAARGSQRVDSRVDAQLGDGAVQNGRCIQVDERRRRCRVGHVVSGNVDGLDGRNGARGGRGNALLQVAHLRRQSGLVAYCRRHTAEQCGNLGARLGEAEDVVDEQQNVLALVAEVLCDGQTSQADAHTCSWRLVHLAVDEAGLVDNARLAHLQEEVRTLTGALAYAGEHGRAVVLLGEVVDELLNQNGLADACAAEQTRLTTADVRLEEVDDLDAGLENLGLGDKFIERRSRTVNRVGLLDVARRLAIDRLADDVPDAAEGLLADRHLDGCTGVNDLGAALQAVRARHSNGTDHVAGEVHLNLEDGRNMTDWSISLHRQRVVDRRDGISRKLAVHDSTNDANDASNVCHRCVLIFCHI